jgi:predicted ATPase
MAVTRVQVENFKSFGKLDIELGPLNVLIGANASGKSNFVQIFRFLRDMKDLGLADAVSLQGGVEYLPNSRISSTRPLRLRVTADLEEGDEATTMRRAEDRRHVAISPSRMVYELQLGFGDDTVEYAVVKDRFDVDCSFSCLEPDSAGGPEEQELLGDGRLTVCNEDGKAKATIEPPMGIELDPTEIWPPYVFGRTVPPRSALLEYPVLFPFFLPSSRYPGYAATYDFDPKLPKKAQPFAGRRDLEEDGRNLAIVLRNIVANPDAKRSFTNLMSDLLPFVSDFGVEKSADQSLLFTLREVYDERTFLPAPLVSDGTINIVALIAALFFEGAPLTVIEEPERNIHPRLIARVMDMVQDAAKERQIILTTQSPELVKHTPPEALLLVSRDKDGFSSVSRPHEREAVKAFLENEIGVEELYVQDLLGA